MLVRAPATVLLVAAVCWALVEAAPGSTVDRAARAGGALPADSARIPAELRAEILAMVTRAHDLEGPASARIWRRVSALARLEFGASWRDGTPVVDALGRAASPTLRLWSMALFLAVLLGLAAAVLSVRTPGGGLDTVLSGLSGLALALPPVWVALLGLGAFADGQPWRVLPPEGLNSPGAYILPLFSMALVPTCVVARHARAALVIAMRSPWAVAARARGASRERVLAVHCVRASLGQLLALLPVLTAYLTGATLVVEEVFGIAGLGALLLDGAQRGDAPVVVGVAVVAAAVIVAVSVGAEFIARRADPREAR